MRFHVVLALVTSSTIAACTLFSGLEGFSGETPGSDAAADADGTVGTPDAPVETGGGDGPPADAADAGRFCATQTAAALCEDFDDDNPLVDWEKVAQPGATFDLVTDRFFSPPRAVRAAVTPFNDRRSAYVFRNLPVAGVVSHARLSYSLYVEQRPSLGEIEVNILRFNCGADCTRDFYLAINGMDADLAEQALDSDGAYPSNYHSLGDKIPTAKWLRVSLEVFLAAPNRKMVLKIDDTQVLDEPTFLVSPGPPSVWVGINFASAGTNSGTVVVDDVLFEILP